MALGLGNLRLHRGFNDLDLDLFLPNLGRNDRHLIAHGLGRCFVALFLRQLQLQGGCGQRGIGLLCIVLGLQRLDQV